MKGEPLYDFPCSSTFRNYEDYWLNGRLYDDSQPEPRVPPLQEIIHRYSDMGADEFRLLQEHDRSLKYLLSKQKERDERKQDYY